MFLRISEALHTGCHSLALQVEARAAQRWLADGALVQALPEGLVARDESGFDTRVIDKDLIKRKRRRSSATVVGGQRKLVKAGAGMWGGRWVGAVWQGGALGMRPRMLGQPLAQPRLAWRTICIVAPCRGQGRCGARQAQAAAEGRRLQASARV